jgi:hypothetical protein
VALYETKNKILTMLDLVQGNVLAANGATIE